VIEGMPGSYQAQLANHCRTCCNKQLMVLKDVSYMQGLLLIHTCIQAVISCFSGDKAHGNMAKIQESQLLQALEYFNLPESMWPLGLYIKHTYELQCNMAAKRFMTTIKADFTLMARQETLEAAAFTKCYCMCDSEHGLYLDVSHRKGNGLSNIVEPLKSRLRDLAAAECMATAFDARPDSYHHGEKIVVSLNR
jgi:hypothetical protein